MLVLTKVMEAILAVATRRLRDPTASANDLRKLAIFSPFTSQSMPNIVLQFNIGVLAGTRLSRHMAGTVLHYTDKSTVINPMKCFHSFYGSVCSTKRTLFWNPPWMQIGRRFLECGMQTWLIRIDNTSKTTDIKSHLRRYHSSIGKHRSLCLMDFLPRIDTWVVANHERYRQRLSKHASFLPF